MALPLERTMAWLRKNNYEVGKVERWNQYARVRQDLFGFIDAIAVGPEGIVGVQATSMDHRSDHYSKILAEPRAFVWLSAGGKIWLVSWRKLKVKRGGKAVRWEPKIDNITIQEFIVDEISD